MPRGGPRPGAGAPRGNTNALRGANHSPRALEVYLALLALSARHEHERLRALFQAAFDANILRLPDPITRDDVAAAVRLWHPMLFPAWHASGGTNITFDRFRKGQSKTIKPLNLQRRSDRRAQTQPLPVPEKTKINRTHDITNNQTPSTSLSTLWRGCREAAGEVTLHSSVRSKDPAP